MMIRMHQQLGSHVRQRASMQTGHLRFTRVHTQAQAKVGHLREAATATAAAADARAVEAACTLDM
jgi:hypothetical protein